MANREETIGFIRAALKLLDGQGVSFESILKTAISTKFRSPLYVYGIDCSRQFAKLAPVITRENLQRFIPGLGNISGVNEEMAKNDPEQFLLNWASVWVRKYHRACSSLPSRRCASESITTHDPAITTILMSIYDIDADEVVAMRNAHRVFESAENVGGNLLEEYIAKSAQMYGWIWCSGSTLRGVDFCNERLDYFIQVKNRDNTHNSSSKSFVQGLEISLIGIGWPQTGMPKSATNGTNFGAVWKRGLVAQYPKTNSVRMDIWNSCMKWHDRIAIFSSTTCPSG